MIAQVVPDASESSGAGATLHPHEARILSCFDSKMGAHDAYMCYLCLGERINNRI